MESKAGVRGTSAFPSPRYGRESAEQFIAGANDAFGGDSGPAHAAATWDRGRTKLRGRQRRGVRAAPRWGDGRHRNYTHDYIGVGHHDRTVGGRPGSLGSVELPDVNYRDKL